MLREDKRGTRLAGIKGDSYTRQRHGTERQDEPCSLLPRPFTRTMVHLEMSRRDRALGLVEHSPYMCLERHDESQGRLLLECISRWFSSSCFFTWEMSHD